MPADLTSFGAARLAAAPGWAAVFAAAALISWIACAAVRRLAVSRGLLSAGGPARAGPGGVPLLGGLGVLIGLAAALGVFAGPAWSLLCAAGLVVGYTLLGLIDDVTGMPPGMRLAGEAVVAAAALGLLHFGPPSAWGAAVPTTAQWVWMALGVAVLAAGANAFNMCDNADGLAAAAGGLSFLALAALLGLGPDAYAWGPAGALAAAGALAGFLWWNRPPARLYLGDAGSLPLGGLAAYLALALVRETPDERLWAALPLLAGYLVVDPVYAVAGRLRRRTPPWRGGVDHLSHHLRAAMGGWPRAWGLIVAIQGFSVLSGVGVAGGVLPPWALLVAACPWAALVAAGRRGAALA
jgi:UDP-N-acetylmuramyl pentapeptide phosphotransferase/UDP-N-acetylglucosamine-1-phosphate transferase